MLCSVNSTPMFCSRASRLPPPVLDSNLVLSDEDDLGQLRNRPVVVALGQPVVGLRRLGEHLRHQNWIEQSVEFDVAEPRLAAGGCNVRIGEKIGGSPNPHVVGINLTGTSRELGMESGEEIAGDQVVLAAGACHGEHLAVEVIALCLRLPLQDQIFLDREPLMRIRRHGRTLPLLTIRTSGRAPGSRCGRRRPAWAGRRGGRGRSPRSPSVAAGRPGVRRRRRGGSRRGDPPSRGEP